MLFSLLSCQNLETLHFVKLFSEASNLMWSETNNWWVHQNSDEDLRLEDLIWSRDPEWLSQTSQTPGQGTKDLIKGHLSSAVILKDRKHKKLRLNHPENKTPNGSFCRHGPNKVQRALGASYSCLVVVPSSAWTGFITSCLTTHLSWSRF